MEIRKLFILFPALLMCSCSTYLTSIPIEMQGNSIAHCDLWQKSVTIAYDHSNREEVNEFHRRYALGFASALETYCFKGESKVEVIELPYSDSLAIYNTKEGLVDLLMESGNDVIIHLPHMKLEQQDLVQYILVYDSKNTKDKVILNKKLAVPPSSSDKLEDKYKFATNFGFKTAMSYVPNWQYEEFPIYTGPAGSDMAKAFKKASDFYWKEAIDLWIPMTRDGNPANIRSQAAFNLAVGCFFEAQYDLADQWLKMSDMLGKTPASDKLHELLKIYRK